MWNQVKAILHLKWMFMCHDATKSTRLLGMIFFYLAFVVMLLVTIGMTIGAVFIGALNIEEKAPWVLVFVLDGATFVFLLMWIISAAQEVQKQSFVDLGKMLYLPIPLHIVYGINMLFSLASPFTLLFVLPLCGLCVGLSWNHGVDMLLLSIPLVLAYFFMLLVWRQYAVDWFLALGPKARRRVIMILSFLSFLPSLAYFGVISSGGMRKLLAGTKLAGNFAEEYVQYHAFIPFGWHGYGLHGLITNNVPEVVIAYAGCGLLLFLGAYLGYRSTLRRYQGATVKRLATVAADPRTAVAARKPLVERALPFTHQDTAALFWSHLLRNVRAQQMTMSCGSILIVAFVACGFAWYRGMAVPPAFREYLTHAPVLAAVWPLFAMQTFVFNQFGLDHNGFRSLMLLPTSRKKYIVARNLAILPFIGGLMALCSVVCAWLLSLAPMAIASALLIDLHIFLVAVIVGNAVSCFLPYKMQGGNLRAQSQPYIALLAALVFMVAMPFMFLPAAALASIDTAIRFTSNYEHIPVAFIGAALLLAATLGAYFLTLGPAADLLMRRETAILEAIIKDKE